MRSKMVTDRLKAHDSVAEALRQLSAKVGKQAEALLAPHLKKGEQMPDLALFAALLERMLGDRAAKMDAADARHNDELADDGEPREERDTAAAELYSAVVDVKDGVGTVFGPKWVAKLKIPAEVPRDPATLARTSADVRKALAETKLPKPRLLGIKSFDVAPWIEQLDEPTKRLEKALKDVTREAREAQATLVEKTRAIAGYDAAFSTGVTCAAGLLRLVGEHEHAARLRPSERRPGTLDTGDGEAAEPGQAPEPA